MVSVYISSKMYHIKVVLHPNWPVGVKFTTKLYLCPFFSFCFIFLKAHVCGVTEIVVHCDHLVHVTS